MSERTHLRARWMDGEADEPAYFEAADGTLLVFVPRARGVVELHCHGPNEHFRDPDGACAHTDEVLSVQTGAGAPIEVLGYRGYLSREAMEADRAA